MHAIHDTLQFTHQQKKREKKPKADYLLTVFSLLLLGCVTAAV